MKKIFQVLFIVSTIIHAIFKCEFFHIDPDNALIFIRTSSASDENADPRTTLIPDLIVHVHCRSVTFQHFLYRARIFKLLKAQELIPRISFPQAYVALRASTKTLFLLGS
jgi:hypothetical protein